jgi:hypothetical protein
MVARLVPTKRGKEMIKKLHKSKGLRKFGTEKPEDLAQSLEHDFKKFLPKHPPQKFQHPQGSIFVIYDEGSNEIFRCQGTIPKKRLNKIASRHPEATILVDVGCGIFKQVAIKTFKKLIKIKYIQFQREYEFFGIDEFEPQSKSGDWFAPDAVIDHVYSINQLLKLFIIEEAFDKANAVYLSARFYDLTGVEKVCKILYNSGQVEVVKYKKFLEDYSLNIEMGLFQPKKKKHDEPEKKSKVELKKEKKSGSKKKQKKVELKKESKSKKKRK